MECVYGGVFARHWYSVCHLHERICTIVATSGEAETMVRGRGDMRMVRRPTALDAMHFADSDGVYEFVEPAQFLVTTAWYADH